MLTYIANNDYNGDKYSIIIINGIIQNEREIRYGNVALLWMPTSKLFKKLYNHPYQEELEKEVGEDSGASMTAKFWKRKEISLLDIAKCVGVALGIVAVSSYITDFFATMLAVGEDAGALAQLPAMIFGNRYVIMTLLSIILVAVFPKFFENMNGAHEIGTFVRNSN